MKLRELELKDTIFMYEWMQDESIVGKLRGDFLKKTIEDVENFIKLSKDKSKSIHLAICSDEDEYMGTVSLKNIKDSSAEFAIVVRKIAMGKGYSWYGMKEIIKKGFEEYGLEYIYWCVSKFNKRAIRFYDKHNFHDTSNIPTDVFESYKEIADLKWYAVIKGDVFDESEEV